MRTYYNKLYNKTQAHSTEQREKVRLFFVLFGNYRVSIALQFFFAPTTIVMTNTFHLLYFNGDSTESLDHIKYSTLCDIDLFDAD